MGTIDRDETDENLIGRLREGESQIMDFIMDKYKDMVKAKAGTMYILGADRDDLIQEGMIGLFKAIRDYDFGRDASFKTFADLCISRQMYSAIQASSRKKHTPLNGYISLYAKPYGQEEDTNSSLDQILESTKDRDPEELIIDQENARIIEEFIETGLSEFEKQVLELYMTGMGYVEIAGILGKDEKSTDNALQRTKSKIRKFVDKSMNK
ncbi:MAG: RNA polymerase sporulation sigma factor SigH [Butyrivibrio sp.]|nr:RNA polymerase sporulation sigma factor SigH [Butyrivibrio sp.]